MIIALVPSINEKLSSIPILTYLGKVLVTSSSSKGVHFDPSGVGIDLGKEPMWSQGLGIQLSPIKTNNACKKAGSMGSSYAIQSANILEQGALTGMKDLAQEKS